MTATDTPGEHLKNRQPNLHKRYKRWLLILISALACYILGGAPFLAITCRVILPENTETPWAYRYPLRPHLYAMYHSSWYCNYAYWWINLGAEKKTTISHAEYQEGYEIIFSPETFIED